MTPPHAPQASRFVRLARACNNHRWRTFFAWLGALVVISILAGAVGKKEVQNVRLPGTESQRAYDLLSAHFPAVKGDTDQVVFKARTGTLQDHRAAIEAAAKKTFNENKDVLASVEHAVQGRPDLQGRQARRRDDRLQGLDQRHRRPEHVQGHPERHLHRSIVRTCRSSTADPAPSRRGSPTRAAAAARRVGILLAAIVLLITFGSLVAAGLPLFSALLALGSAIGLITFVSHLVDTPDFASQLAELIGLGVGIDYALFVVTRFRSEVRGGMDRDLAIEKAIDTAGRTVMFAAITVVIALLGMLLLGLSFMHGVAIGSAIAVATVAFAAMTVIPAMIGGSGPVLRRRPARVRPPRRLPLRRHPEAHPAAGPRLPRHAGPSKKAHKVEGHGWERWTRGVQAHPWIASILSLAILIGLAIPALSIRLGSLGRVAGPGRHDDQEGL